jgi:hypothetical protein
MSFQVVRHEHPDIFVLNRQTYETYRFTVGDDDDLAHDGAPSDLGKARRTAIAFLAQSQKNGPHVDSSGPLGTPPGGLFIPAKGA